MAYDEGFAQRVRALVAGLPAVTEKRMFGGLGFMLAGNMAVAVQGKGGLLVRVNPDEVDVLLAEPGASLMQMGGRSMRGWITVRPEAVARDADLRRWVKRGVEYAQTLPPK